MKLLHRKSDSTALLSSKLFDEESFYDKFAKDLKHALKTVVIESPYLTEKRALQFAKLFSRLTKQGVEIRINTRHPEDHDKVLEIQAWRALRILKDSGARVFMCSDLRHRKLAIVDEQILWEGSLNILSQSNSKEIMRRTVSADLARQMVSFTKVNRRYL